MHFGENQLSPGLIGLSPLPTAHPPGFQPWWVRSSTRSYPRFNLAMGRSPGYGSRARDYDTEMPHALFGLAFATATPHGLTSPRTANSQAHSSKGTQSPRPEGLKLSRLVGTRFQVLFHSPPGVLFTFPSRYLSAIGHQGVFRLSGWSRQIHTEFHGLGATGETAPGGRMVSVYGALTLYGHPFQRPSTNQPVFMAPRRPGRTSQTVPRPHLHNPGRVSDGNGLASSAFARHYSRNHCCFLFLWVLRCFTSPRSLHTPYVFRRGSHHMTGAGFPHSDTLGSTLGWQLPEAYRSLPRPSSAPGAQASTVCP